MHHFYLPPRFKMLCLVVLVASVILASGVTASDIASPGNAEFDTRVADVVRAMLQDEGFGDLVKTVSDLQTKVALQEKQIQMLKARDKRREKVVVELLSRVVSQAGNSSENANDKVNVSKNDGRVKTLNENTKDGIQRRALLADTEYVGFTAYLDHNIDTMAHGHTIKCNKVLLNDGSGYNNTTGVFTVPISGVYLFNFHFNSHYRKTLVGLMVDGQNEVDAIAVPKDSSQEMMGGNTALLRLAAGQSVWLEDIIVDNGEIYSIPNARYATFSGVLMY